MVPRDYHKYYTVGEDMIKQVNDTKFIYWFELW